jgi:hypothetical protein
MVQKRGKISLDILGFFGPENVVPKRNDVGLQLNGRRIQFNPSILAWSSYRANLFRWDNGDAMIIKAGNTVT